MRKTRYYYNPTTCSYEPIQLSLLTLFIGIACFVFISFIIASVITRHYRGGFISLREIALQEDNQRLRDYYSTIEKKIESSSQLLSFIQERDDTIYRMLLGKPLLSDVERNAGMGGVDKYADLDKDHLIAQTLSKADQLLAKLAVQKKSYDELLAHAHTRERKFKSMPTFPPLSKRYLKGVSSGFGMRMDPILKVHRMHEAIDFAAPMHTPIYAAADGYVKLVKQHDRGYGNSLLLEHANGFQTRYAHMHTVLIKERQQVKRGQQIGTVGTSGRSTGPHLHYEVYCKGVRVDPVRYLVWELTPSEYEAVCKQATQNRQMLCY